MQGKHCVAPLVKEKLEPSTQGVHTLSDVVVQGACWYVPAGHAPEQDKHCVAPLVFEKLKSAKQGVHTVAPLVVEKEPGEQGVHTLFDVLVQAV